MPLRNAVFVLLFVLAATVARGQEDFFEDCMEKTTAHTYAGYFLTRGCLYDRLNRTDTATAKIVVARLEAEAIHRADPRLRLYAKDAYIEYVLKRRVPQPVDSILGCRQALVADAARLGEPAFLVWTEHNYAVALYLLAREYDRAFEGHLRVCSRLRQMQDAELPDRRNFLATIAHHYYDFGEYRQAVHFLSEAVAGRQEMNSPTSYEWRQGYNTLGLCYRELGLYDSSDHYFAEALRISLREGRRHWAGIARGNLGINLYRRGRRAEAAPLLAEDLKLSIERSDWNNAAGAALPLAGIALESGRTAEAAVLLDTARQFIGRSPRAAPRLPLYHSLRIREAAARGDARLATLHTDSLVAAKDSLSREYNALHLVRAGQRVAGAETRAKLASATAQQRVTALQRNALVVILVLSAGLAALAVISHRRRRRAAAEKAAAEVRAKEAELRAKVAELRAAESTLHRFRADLQEKAALIERLSAQLDEGEHSAILQQLRDATILTDAQWAEFRRMFEKVHAGFIERLGRQYAGLTPAEVRYLVLARLGFSTKEMAGAMGISASTVRVTWHRLRKKLGVNEEAGVEALVEGI